MKYKTDKVKNRSKTKKKGVDKELRCPYCGSSVVYRSADGIYKENRDGKMLYVCARYPECDAYIAANPHTKLPMGTMANGNTRALRIKAHNSFNKVFESGIMSKDDAYRWLGLILGIPYREAHIRMMGDYDCKRVIEESERMVERWKQRHPWRNLGEEHDYETDS